MCVTFNKRWKSSNDMLKKVKITITDHDRVVMIPMEYDTESDSLSFNEIQIDPIPEKEENISKDIVMNLAYAIIAMLQNK